jgi:hypothetical protein
LFRAELSARLEELENEFAQSPASFKSNVLFVNHSALLPQVIGGGASEWKLPSAKQSVLWCRPEALVVEQRLQAEAWFKPDAARARERVSLSGSDMESRLNTLNEAGRIDGIVNTTSIKQAIVQLHTMLGITFRSPFDQHNK